MRIETVVVTPFQQNARILIDEQSGDAVIVDPGGDVAQLIDWCADQKVKISKILLTHAHIDHAGGVKKLLSRLAPHQAQLYAHGEGRELRQSIAMQATMFGLSPQEYENCPEPDVVLSEGDDFAVGDSVGKVLFTPGHSPGHISIYFAKEKQVIAGDALFAGSIGRTDLPGGDHRTLIRSIREKLLTLPDDTVVLSGHGPNTTIGRERKSNPFLTVE